MAGGCASFVSTNFYSDKPTMAEINEIPILALKEIELFDVPILHHGLESYNRDYYFIIESGTKENQGRFKIWFTHCFDFQYRHKFADPKFPDLIRRSWDDNLILPTIPEKSDGYWWGQGFTDAYEGFSYNPDNNKAKEMSEITGRQMYSVTLDTGHFTLDFVFHDFRYRFLGADTSISDQTFIPVKDFKFKK
jgi:hypothetical protein